VSTFYVLPPRSLVGEYFAGFLGTLFPGLNWTQEHWIELANLLGTTASQHPEVYVLHREDLPDGEDLTRALVDGFGAEVGDQIIEVRAATEQGDLVTQHWLLSDPLGLPRLDTQTTEAVWNAFVSKRPRRLRAVVFDVHLT
jgi:hypothetical protein